jgi:hypothetical protein
MESQSAQSLKATALKSITEAATTVRAIKNRKLTGKLVCKNSIVALMTTLPFPCVSDICVLTLATDVLIPTTIGTGEVPVSSVEYPYATGCIRVS